MRTMKKSAIFLAAALTVLLCACASEPAQTEQTQPTDETTEAVTEAVTEIDYTKQLPDADYGGEIFTIIAVSEEKSLGTVSYYREAENGDAFNDFIYNRNRDIEERYNIKIEEFRTDDITGNVKKVVGAGGDDYDMISDWIMNIVSGAPNGYYYNLLDIEDLNLENPWWDQQCIAPLTISDKLFAAFSDMNTQPLDRLQCVFYNQDIVSALDLETPYEAVLNGTWTMDRFHEMCKEAALDADGDGKVSEGDRFGFIVGVGSFSVWMNAANEPLVTNENGNMTLNYGTEQGINAAAKIAEIINDPNYTVYLNEKAWGSERFNSGYAMFSEGTIGKLNQYRDLEFSLGVLPVPKLNEEQDQYYSMMSNNDMGVTFPTTASDISRSATIVEALGAYSYEKLHEVYYEITLQDKLTRDEYSPKMLDIIIDSKVVDIGIINESAWGNSIGSFFSEIRKNGADNFASLAAKNESQFVSVRDKIVANYEALD